MEQFTPYILFFFGVVITYIGWSTKKILQNIETTVTETAQKVANHDKAIVEILGVLKLHDYRITHAESKVAKFKNSAKIE